MIVIGASLGGTTAVRGILKGLPEDFAAPIVVALHRHRESDEGLLEILGRDSRLPVREPSDKEPVLPGCVQVAPADYHLLIDEGCFALSVDEPVSYSRPSIDVLFESAADAYGPRVIGVLLTGANQDGAKGCARIRQRGGIVVVQDPSTAQSPVMPAAALALGAANYLCTLEEIPGLLLRLVRDGGAAP